MCGTPSGVKTIADLKAKPQVHMGLTGMGSSSDTNQRILKSIFGVRIQQVAGYPGSAEQRIAIERGELDGDCGAWSSIPLEWIEGRKIVPVIRSSPSIAPDMPPDVPYSVDIAPSERDRQIVAHAAGARRRSAGRSSPRKRCRRSA